jgi:hypothetical protein
MASRAHLGLALVIAAIAASGGACTCSKGSEPASADAGEATSAEGGEVAAASSGEARDLDAGRGLSAPIAAARGERGEVVVAALDVAARAIRVQRISAKDEILAERTIFDGAGWTSEAELKVMPAEGGVAVVWRGLRAKKPVRQALVLGPDLAPVGDATDVAPASCATRDALWYTDGRRIHSRPWKASPTRTSLPADKEGAVLVCGAHRAFGLFDDDDGTSLMTWGGVDGGAAAGVSLTSLLKESDFGEDEQRERSEYTVGDDIGVVRLSVAGAVSMREVRGGVPGPLRKLKTTIPRDDDVVAVDASPRAVVIVFTEDVGEACPKGDSAGANASTRVKALRVERATLEESVVELSPGMCGREVGPFFTGAIGDTVSVAWVERVPVAGMSRAPIAGLAHRAVPAAGPAGELARIDQPADALVDAGCDGARCYAVALARHAGMDAMVPGLARVLRY